MDVSALADRYKELSENVKAMVGDIATGRGFTDYELEVGPGSAKGDNYVGVILRVRITGRRGGKDGESTSLIVKIVPMMHQVPEQDARGREFFENEVFMYKEVLAAFSALQERKRVPEAERFASSARWYGCDRSEDGLAVVLEDMAARGYRLGDRIAGLDAAHCSLVVRQLGKLHAFSFALRDQQPREFRHLHARVKENAFRRTWQEQTTAYFRTVNEHNVSVLLNHFQPESKYVQRLREFGSDFAERMSDVVSGEAAEPYSVICHGDTWTNNILFKYSEVGNTPVDVCLLDLQLARYSSPITDVAYFLFCCVEGDVRREIYESMMDDYYNSFSQFLRKLGSDPEKLFPRSAFEEHQRNFSRFGLAMAVLAMPVFSMNSEDAPDFINEGTRAMEDSFSKGALNAASRGG